MNRRLEGRPNCTFRERETRQQLVPSAIMYRYTPCCHSIVRLHLINSSGTELELKSSFFPFPLARGCRGFCGRIFKAGVRDFSCNLLLFGVGILSFFNLNCFEVARVYMDGSLGPMILDRDVL